LEDVWFRDRLEHYLDTAADRLHAAGVSDVVFLTPLPPPPAAAEEDRNKMRATSAIYLELIERLARQRPHVHVVDYGGWIDEGGADEAARLVPDGIHATPETATEIWVRFLGPAIEQVTRVPPQT
jgi:hypothetical protein